jgi:hypothetical protein
LRGAEYDIGSKGLGSLLYIEDLNAYLIKPTFLEDNITYGDFARGDVDRLTSIVTKDGSRLADWNYNYYEGKAFGYALHTYASSGLWLRNLSGWADLSGNFPDALLEGNFSSDAWVPAPVGIPGLLGYPSSTSAAFADRETSKVYAGIAHTVRNVNARDLPAITTSKETLQYSIIHATPYAVWLQSCGFTFTFLAESPLAPAVSEHPALEQGEAVSAFDWEEFTKNVGLQNVDDWLTIGIITVLNILPRIFMFIFILLMGLALIADVKLWQAFCDKIIDPYKVLTLGRQTVHTIRIRSIFLYSIISLALFGMFQNGLILDVIAWVARAITGILRR